MASPVALGDIALAVGLVIKGVNALRDQAGARDDYQRFSARVQRNLTLLKSIENLQSLFISTPEHHGFPNAIKSCVQRMSENASELQRKLLPIEKKLGVAAPKRWHHDVISKTRFQLLQREDLEKLYKDLEADGRVLDRLLLAQASYLATKEALAFSKRQKSVSQEAISQDTASSSRLLLPKPSESGPSSPSLAASRSLVHLQPNIISSRHTDGQPIFHVETGRQRIVVTADFDPSDPAQMKAMLQIVFACVWYGALGVISQLGLNLIPLMLIMLKPSANVSLLLPDNFILHDALGRIHSLPVHYFGDWSVLESLIKSRFKDCAGFDKVISGQYAIFSVDNALHDLGANNWNQHLKQRARFRMAIKVLGPRLFNEECTSCGKRLRKYDRLHLVCPRSGCGRLVRAFAAHKPSVAMLRAIATKALLEVPSGFDALTLVSQSLDEVEKRFNGMVWGYEAARRQQTSPFPHKKSNQTSSDQANGQRAPTSGDIESSNAGISSKITGLDSDSMQAMEADTGAEYESTEVLEDVDQGPEASTTSLMEEQEEMKHFFSVCMKQDTRLYDAATNQDVYSVRKLLEMGVEVGSNLGTLGTALIPAIITKNPTLVDMFLRYGADPMENRWSHTSPLSLAVTYGNRNIFRQVLLSAASQSSARPGPFQRALDVALYEATREGEDAILRTLLSVGANPVAMITGGQSPFDAALGKRLKYVYPLFLATLWDKGLLSDSEASYLADLLEGHVQRVPEEAPWLEACGTNLQIRNAKILGDRIKSRLKRGKAMFNLGAAPSALSDFRERNSRLTHGNTGGNPSPPTFDPRVSKHVPSSDDRKFPVTHDGHVPTITIDQY